MTPPTEPHWEQVLEVFGQLVEAEAARRPALLEELCAGDTALAREVASLLAADESSPELFLEGSELLNVFEGARPREELGLRPGGQFAGYRILGLLAEGGMGAVYRARQENPARDVALKVLRSGPATEDLCKRFEREVDVLGRLQHKGIAAIHEAGVHADVPYFVMEYVRGVPLTASARARTQAGAIELMLSLCDAVQYAHEQGVVHRDLKPANVLVDERGEPRVLDFGIAQLSESGTQHVTLATNPGQILGTLAYMSPEQAEGKGAEVDARADVYALGVMLYELLAGRRPVEIEGRSIPEAVRLVCEKDPTLLGDVLPALRGDLETIAAKALEKEPSRRYATAAALAADLRRARANLPIAAVPASTLYQLRKFARRHRGLAAGLGMTMLALAVGTMVSLRFGWLASEQRDLAESVTQEARLELARMSLNTALQAAERGDADEAARILATSPEEWRGFEHAHVAARIDAAIGGLTGNWRPVAWLPDDETLLVVGGDRLRLWQPLQQRTLAEWSTSEAVTDVELSDDGLLVAVASGHSVTSWNTSTGELVARSDFDEMPTLLDFAPGESRLAVVMPTKLVQVDAANGERLDTWESVAGDVLIAAFSPDGRWLVVRTDSTMTALERTPGGRVQVWESQPRKSTWQDLKVAFHPDGRHMTARQDLWLATFDLETGAVSERIGVQHDQVRYWDFDERRGLVATAGISTGVTTLFELGTGELVDTLLGSSLRSYALAYSPSGGTLAVGNEEGGLRLHGPGGTTRFLASDHGDRVTALIWNRDGSLLASGSLDPDSAVRVWDPRATHEPGVRVLRGHENWLYDVAFSSDGAWLASTGWDATVRLWEVATGEQIVSFQIPRAKGIGVAFSGDDSMLFVASSKTALAIDLRTAEVGELSNTLTNLAVQGALWELMAEHGNSRSVALTCFLALHPSLQVRSWVSLQRFWLLRPGEDEEQALDDLVIHPDSDLGNVTGVALDVDADRIAAAWRDGSIRVLDAATEQVIGRMDIDTRPHGLAFSPDGERLVVGGRDGSVHVFDARAYVPLAEFFGHEGYVHTAAFSPDGRTLATASGDFTARLWETGTARERLARELEARAARETARAYVLALFEELDDSLSVCERIRADPALDELTRRAARAEALREALRRRG